MTLISGGGINEQKTTPGVDALDRQRFEAELDRLLEDTSFAATPDRRRMLSYLVRETLAGNGPLLKGVVIAQDVFGRGADFDPGVDPVVRIEAHRLRRDLDSYYVNFGDRAPIQFEIPKGAYVVHFRDTVPPAPPEDTVWSDEAELPPKKRKLWPYAVAAVLAIAVLAGALLFRPSRVATPQGYPNVAVEPFTALGGSEELAYLAEGMSHELVDSLMRFRTLNIYAIPASRAPLSPAYLESLKQDRDIGYIATGSLSQSAPGNDIRLIAMLTRHDGNVLWSGTFDSSLSASDVLKLQEDLASQVASALAQTYGVVASDLPVAPAREALPSDTTFACLQRAQHYRRAFDAKLRGRVRDCLERAVERDPQVAEGWAMLGWVLLETTLFERVNPEERSVLINQSLAATERAVELAPDAVLPLQARAATLFYAERFAEAESAIRRAYEINPNDPEILHQMGWRLAARGKLEEGVGYIRQAIARSIDPPPRYFNFLAIDALVKADYPAMLTYARQSANGGSPVGNILLAIALGHSPDATPNEIAAAFERAGKRQPMILSTPEKVFAGHRLVPELATAIIAGMTQAGWSPSR